jgi:hypothetical protein
MDRAQLAVLTLRLDAVANLGLAVAVTVGARSLAGVLGLPEAWPLLLVAGALVANGALCWASSSAPRASSLRRLAAVDVVFALAVLAVAAWNPGGLTAPPRWLLAGLGDVVLIVAAIKAWCAGGIPQPAGHAASS